jgi:hypothetical protein
MARSCYHHAQPPTRRTFADCPVMFIHHDPSFTVRLAVVSPSHNPMTRNAVVTWYPLVTGLIVLALISVLLGDNIKMVLMIRYKGVSVSHREERHTGGVREQLLTL